MFGFSDRMNAALGDAIRKKGPFTPNGAPTGLGQPLSGKELPQTPKPPVAAAATAQGQLGAPMPTKAGAPAWTPAPAPTPGSYGEYQQDKLRDAMKHAGEWGQLQPHVMPKDPSIAAPSRPLTPPAATPAAPAIDRSGWNTDKYAAPQHTAQTYGTAMAGWDQNKWADPNHQTPKYAVGRILSNYTPGREGLQQASAEIAKAYPGTVWNGKDKLTIPGVGTIDVGQAFTSGKDMKWWWGAPGQPGGGQPQQGQPVPNMGVNDALSSAVLPGAQHMQDFSPTGASDRLAALLAQLQLGSRGLH